MNIEREIIELQKQIDSLKKKQKEISRVKVSDEGGELFIKDGNDSLLILICNIEGVWMYTYDDGSGKSFDSKEELEHYLSVNGYAYYFRSCVFEKTIDYV